MPKRRFAQVDVFTDTPARGNGLAVVIDSEGLSTEDMQGFATWTNLAETTFLLPPEDPSADYKLRIFTPGREMLFAGHPTLGSCAVWLAHGGVPRDPLMVRQECGVGIVEIDQTGPQPAFIAPPTKIAPMADEMRAAICAKVGLDAARILHTAELDNGPVWQAFELDSAESVLALEAARLRYPEFRSVGFMGEHPEGHDLDYEVRMLAPYSGMLEDPITGSLNAALAHWLAGQGRVTAPYVAAQGTVAGRVGRVSVRPRGDDVLIGGNTVAMIEGTLTF